MTSGAVSDAAGDTAGNRDVVGNATTGAGLVHSDGAFLYVRTRINDSPTQGPGLRPYRYGAILDVNATPASYELMAVANGDSELVELLTNTSVLLDNPSDPPETQVAANSTSTHARVVLATSSFELT